MTPDRLLSAVRAALNDLERALIRYRDGHDGPCVNFEGQDPADYDEYDSCAGHLAVAEATPYRDVEFGLRDIESKREILDAHPPLGVTYWPTPMCGICAEPDAEAVDDPLGSDAPWWPNAAYPCPTVRALARGLGINPEETE